MFISRARSNRRIPAEAVSGIDPLGRGLGCGLLVVGVGLEHECPHAFLRSRISDWPEQREAAPIATDGVLTRRERDVAARSAASLPHGEADKLQALEHAFC